MTPRYDARWPRVVGLLVGLLIALTLILLVSVPVRQSFSIVRGVLVDTLGGSACQGSFISIPAGAHVSFRWQVVLPFAQHFVVSGCSGLVAFYYSSTGLNGSGSFVSEGGRIIFGTVVPADTGSPEEYGANVSGTYTVALLP